MNTRITLYALLTVVAGCAAVLSFAALRDLALVCGFVPWSAPLLPLVIDAGAAAGSVAWLTGGVHDSVYPTGGRARRFGRALALALLAASVAGNAVGHALAAYAAVPPWWLVVAVSGVAPAVLGGTAHLAVVASQDVSAPAESDEDGLDDETGDDDRQVGDDLAADLIAAGAGRRRLSRELGVSEHTARALLDGARNGSGVTR